MKFTRCPRCSDHGVVVKGAYEGCVVGENGYACCSCVLGALLREQFARLAVGATHLDFSAFYAQRALSLQARDNRWRPSE